MGALFISIDLAYPLPYSFCHACFNQSLSQCRFCLKYVCVSVYMCVWGWEGLICEAHARHAQLPFSVVLESAQLNACVHW